MRLVSLTTLATLAMLLTGCIIYAEDDRLDRRDGGDPPISDDDDVPDDGTPDDDVPPVDDPPPPVDPDVLSFDPDWALPGETVIVDLVANEDDVDLSAVVEVEFLGDGAPAVLTTKATDDGFLLTLAVAEDAPLGPVDAVVRFAEADPVFLVDAFLVGEPQDEVLDTAAPMP